MPWASKSFSMEQSDPRIPLKKSTFSTGCADRIARSKKMGSNRHFFDCVRTTDLVSHRKSPFSVHRSDCIRINWPNDVDFAIFEQQPKKKAPHAPCFSETGVPFRRVCCSGEGVLSCGISYLVRTRYEECVITVSYTHLTLPTKRIV